MTMWVAGKACPWLIWCVRGPLASCKIKPLELFDDFPSQNIYIYIYSILYPIWIIYIQYIWMIFPARNLHRTKGFTVAMFDYQRVNLFASCSTECEQTALFYFACTPSHQKSMCNDMCFRKLHIYIYTYIYIYIHIYIHYIYIYIYTYID